MDLSPRAIKRLINVSKIIKIVWFRSRIEPEEDTVRGGFSLLALSSFSASTGGEDAAWSASRRKYTIVRQRRGRRLEQ